MLNILKNLFIPKYENETEIFKFINDLFNVQKI